MSLIAEALKKDKKNKNKSIRISRSRKKSVNFNFIYLIILLIFFIAIIVNYYFINMQFGQISIAKYPSIEKLQKDKQKKIRYYRENVKQMMQNEIILALMENDLNKAYDLMEKNKNYEYKGIYYYKKKEYGNAAIELNKCYENSEGETKSLCGYYLALLHYKNKDFSKSIQILKSLEKTPDKDKNLSCAKKVLLAVDYELTNNKYKAIRLYDEIKNECESPPLKHKVVLKLFFLKNIGEL